MYGKGKIVAGSSTKLNPKVPNRAGENEDYNLTEDVNQGPHGGKGKTNPSPAFGQNSDNMGEKDELIGISGGHQDPYRARGSDFANGRTSADVGTGQGSGATWESRDGGNKNELVGLDGNQCSPRDAEDDGMGEHGSGTPVPGDRAARVDANFKINRNSGEARGSTGEVGIAEFIDLQEGYIRSSASRTPVDEVPEASAVRIPSAKSAGSKGGRVARDLK